MEDRRPRNSGNKPVRPANDSPKRGGMTDSQQMELQRMRTRRQKLQRQYKIVSWILTGIFVVILYAVICLIIGNRKFYDKTSINGIDVGKMKPTEAARLVSNQYDRDYSSASVRIELNGQRYTLNISEALDRDSYSSVYRFIDFMSRKKNMKKSNDRHDKLLCIMMHGSLAFGKRCGMILIRSAERRPFQTVRSRKEP